MDSDTGPRQPPTHYQVLDVSPGASPEEVRAGYRAAARRAHPDAGGSADAMRRVNLAWQVLNDPARRAAYDRSLREAPSGPAAGPTRQGRREDGNDDRPGHGGDVYGDGPGTVGTDGDGRDAPGWVPADEALVPVEGWLAILPAGVLVAAAVLLFAAFLFASPALLVFAAGTGFASLGLFVLVPLLVMLRDRRR